MLKKILKSEFARNFAVLFGGNTLGQAIALLIYPLLTRLFTDADFGAYSLFLSITGVLVIIGTGRYEEALVIAKDEKETRSLFSFAAKWLLIFSLLIFFVLLFFKDQILSIFHAETISSFWYLIPIALFFTGITYLCNDLLVRLKQFKRIAAANLTTNISASVLKAAAGFLSFGGAGIIVSHIGSYICTGFLYLKHAKKYFIVGEWRLQKKTAAQYSDFPKYNTGRTLVSYLTSNAPFLLLTATFGESPLGLLSLAMIIFRPVNLVAGSLFSVFYEKITSLKNDKKSIKPLLTQYWSKAALLAIPLLIVAWFVAPWVFRVVFGEMWIKSAYYFRMLLPWILAVIWVAPVKFIPIVFGKQKPAFYIEIICFAVQIFTLIAAIYLKNFDLAIQLFALINFVFNILLLGWFFSLTNRYEKKLKSENLFN